MTRRLKQPLNPRMPSIAGSSRKPFSASPAFSWQHPQTRQGEKRDQLFSVSDSSRKYDLADITAPAGAGENHQLN